MKLIWQQQTFLQQHWEEILSHPPSQTGLPVHPYDTEKNTIYTCTDVCFEGTKNFPKACSFILNPSNLIMLSKQCRPRSNCSFRSSLIRVYTVCHSSWRFKTHNQLVKWAWANIRTCKFRSYPVISLMLSMLSNYISRRHFDFFFFFLENKLRHFIHIVCMKCRPIFWEKYEFFICQTCPESGKY